MGMSCRRHFDKCVVCTKGATMRPLERGDGRQNARCIWAQLRGSATAKSRSASSAKPMHFPPSYLFSTRQRRGRMIAPAAAQAQVLLCAAPVRSERGIAEVGKSREEMRTRVKVSEGRQGQQTSGERGCSQRRASCSPPPVVLKEMVGALKSLSGAPRPISPLPCSTHSSRRRAISPLAPAVP
jgi:hypothetical protein